MPVRQARSVKHGRPPRGLGTGAGKSGSTNCHSLSGTSVPADINTSGGEDVFITAGVAVTEVLLQLVSERETSLTNSKSPGSLGRNCAVGSVIDLDQ